MRHWLLAWLLILLPAFALADPPPPRSTQTAPAPAVISTAPLIDLDGLMKEVDKAQKSLELAQEPPDDSEIQTLRARLAEIRADAAKAKSNAAAMQASLTDQITALGPQPAEGEPAEAAEITKLRKSLDLQVTGVRARTGKADLLDTKAAALDAALTDAQRAETTRVLTKRGPMLVAFEPLLAGFVDLGRQTVKLTTLPYRWWSQLKPAQRDRLPWIQLTILLILAGFAGYLSRFAVSRRLTHTVWPDEPKERHKVSAALLAMLARGLVPGAVLLFLLIVALRATDGPNAPLTGVFGLLVVNSLLALLLFVLIESFLRVIFNPLRRGLRLTAIDRDKGKLLYRGFSALTLFFLFDSVLFGVLNGLGLKSDSPGEAVYDFLTGVTEGMLILWLMRTKYWQSDDTNAPPLYPIIRRLVSLAVIVALGSQLAGYHSFGWFILGGMIMTGGVAIVILVTRLVTRAALFAMIESPRMIALFKVDPVQDRPKLEFWMRLLFDPALIGCLIFLSAPIWHVSQDSLVETVNRILNGFDVGEVTLKPLNLLYGIGVLIGLLALTRGAQRGLTNRIMPSGDFSDSTRHAASAAIGYIGVAMSLAIAVSVMGLSLSNLALITSALSVGIGFGLRDVIANFVAGMLILFDRPIRVGDRIKMNAGEGTVRKMSLRATEIETGQRGTLLVPNLSLLTEPVTNWSLGDSSLRFTIPVTVAYGSNLERLTEIMLGAAEAHAEIRKFPVPRVLMTAFGPPGHILELAVVTGNGQNKGLIESDLRLAISRGIDAAPDVFWIKGDGSPVELNRSHPPETTAADPPSPAVPPAAADGRTAG